MNTLHALFVTMKTRNHTGKYQPRADADAPIPGSQSDLCWIDD
jgi:hypothetical protein